MNTKRVVILTCLCSMGTLSASCADASGTEEVEAMASPPATAAPADVAEAEQWTARTPGGLEVVLRPAAMPVTVGTMHFDIEFSSPPPDGAVLSIDLISPDMPMMGVRRFPVTPGGSGHMAMAEIPMTGRWNAYVNIGDGLEAAEFAFAVVAGEGDSGAMNHEGHSSNQGR